MIHIFLGKISDAGELLECILDEVAKYDLYFVDKMGGWGRHGVLG